MKHLNSKLFVVTVMTWLTMPAMSFADGNSPQNMAGPMGGPGGGPMGSGPMHGPMGGGMMNHEAMQQNLHDQLKLTADQEGAWKTFIGSMKPPQSTPKDSTADWGKLTTPQRADKMLAMAKMHQQEMESHVKALKTFYAALTPAQQKIFDNVHSGHGAMMQQRMEHRGMPSMDRNDMPMNK